MTRYARILSTGRYIPERVMTNAELDALLGEPVSDWLVENVGIRERRLMAPEQTTSDLCVAAAQDALRKAGLSPADLDLIIVATDTPDYLSPATASVVQAGLGAPRAGTFDVNCACAGWVTGLDIAAKYMASDADYRHVLVVGGYGMSRFINWKDKKTCTLFADGGGAVVLGVGDQPGFAASKLLAVGEYHDALGIYTGGAKRPASPEQPRLARAAAPARRIRAQISKNLQQRTLAALDPCYAGKSAGRSGRPTDARRDRQVLLHATQPAHNRVDDGRARPADGQDSLDHGQVGLHRLGLHPHGPRRRARAGARPTARRVGDVLRQRRRHGDGRVAVAVVSATKLR